MKKITNLKLAGLAVCSAALIGLTSCGASTKNTDSDTAESTTTAQESTSETTPAEIAASEVQTEAQEVSRDYHLDFALVPGLSEQYVDMEKYAFAYNGQVFQLGVNTIGDLLDAGMEFNNADIELDFLNHEMGVNQETVAFNFYINQTVHVRFTGFNPTEHLLPCKECVLSTVEFNLTDTIRNDTSESMVSTIVNGIEEANEILKFSFPMDLRLNDLLEKNPEPSENEGVDGVRYMVKSKILYPTGYYFRFGKDTQIMNHFLMRWLPV